MSDPNSDSPETDPSLAPTVDLVESTQPGSVHVVLSIPTQAEPSAAPPGPTQPPKPDEATQVGTAIVGGAAKVVGKVLGEIWDSVKPKEN